MTLDLEYSDFCEYLAAFLRISSVFLSQLPQTKTAAAQRFRPLDSTSDPHLHITRQAPVHRPHYRAVPPIPKVKASLVSQQTGECLTF